MDDRYEEIPPELAQYLARSLISILPAEVYEELKTLSPEELHALTRLGIALRSAGAEQHAYMFMIH